MGFMAFKEPPRYHLHQVFPSESPSSRTDAVMLDNWISREPKINVDQGPLILEPCVSDTPQQKHCLEIMGGVQCTAIHLKLWGRYEYNMWLSEVVV